MYKRPQAAAVELIPSAPRSAAYVITTHNKPSPNIAVIPNFVSVDVRIFQMIGIGETRTMMSVMMSDTTKP